MTPAEQTHMRRGFLAGAATGLLAGCAAPAVRTANGEGTTERKPFDLNDASWPMEGYDAGNTKYSAAVTVPDVDERWRVRGATEQGDVLGTPAAADGVLFIGNGYRMLGLDAAGGEIRWSRTLNLQVAFFSPAVSDGTVIVPGVSMDEGANGLYALAADDGTTQWHVETPVSSSPVVVGDAVYVSVDSADGKTLSVRSIEDGTERLAVEFEPVENRARYATKPAVVDETIYLPVRGLDGDGTSTVVALGATDGDERWRRPIGSEVHAAPVVADGRVFVGTVGGEVVAIDAASGEVDWTAESVEAVRKPPCVGDGTLYIVDTDDVVHALDTDGGIERWTVATTGPHQTRPVVGDGTVVLSGNTILALDATDGERHWEFDLSSMASSGFTPAALFNGALAVASCTKSDNSQRMYDNNVHLLG